MSEKQKPKCPDCGRPIDVEDFTILELAKDGEYEIIVYCPICGWEPLPLVFSFSEFLVGELLSFAKEV